MQMSYTGKTDRTLETRKKKNQNKVRLTRRDLKEDQYDKAENRMIVSMEVWQDLQLHVEIDWEKVKKFWKRERMDTEHTWRIS